MTSRIEKTKTRSFAGVKTPEGSKKERMGYSPERSEGKTERSGQDMYRVRFKRKDLTSF